MDKITSAAKYLFNKYVRSFDMRDGLCFEYNVSQDDPPLTLAEVNKKRRAWMRKHPGSIAQSTIQALREIEWEYAGLRVRFQRRRR